MLWRLTWASRTDRKPTIQHSWTDGRRAAMATMVLLDNNGEKVRTLGSIINPNPDLVIPQGWMLSWENQFMEVTATDRLKNAVLTHGKALVLVNVVMQTLVVRIESPNVRDLVEAIDLMVQYVGGEVATCSPSAANNSFVGGIKNDLVFLRNMAVRAIRSLRQRTGFKIAR